ncbi:MAG: hypothetical protein JXR68_12765 [Bacteroidales bacterium]|nr:hypothetical protein [Bacteroidales bacterium]
MTAKQKLCNILGDRVNGWKKNNCEDKITELLSFNSFNLNYQTSINIDENTQQINVFYELPGLIDVTNLVAIFTVDLGNIVSVNNIEQLSEVTQNDFTNPVIYTISNGIIKTYWTVIFHNGI